MYFVDRNKIGLQLHYLQTNVELLEKQSTWETLIEKAALERITHRILELILDIGNGMIDGFIMRDPGSYEDIIDILTDEKVYADNIGHDLKTLLLFRKKLVHDYTHIEHVELYRAFFEKISSLREFKTAIENYLIHELGPVTAFKN
ncbi:MAG: DUF86 domain-containing protein [Bacillus sp. (in: firmicutes)]